MRSRCLDGDAFPFSLLVLPTTQNLWQLDGGGSRHLAIWPVILRLQPSNQKMLADGRRHLSMNLVASHKDKFGRWLNFATGVICP